jgi:hypothetical protein
MADTTEIEKTSPPMYDIKSPLDVSKFNPVAASSDPEVAKQQQKILDSQDQLAQSLEDRYSNPNWFKVAAGFLKPQLGGFAASLGSASEALGQNVESQRAIAPTIQRMRAEVAQGRLGMETAKSQYQALQDYNQKGKDDTTELQRILAMSPSSDVGKAILEKMRLDQSQREKVGFGLDTAIKATTAMAKDPMLQLGDYTKFQLQSNPEQAAAKQAEFAKAVEASRPPQVAQAQWDAMDRYEKMSAASEYAKAQREAGMGTEEALRQKANTAPERLGLLRSIRDLALGSGLSDSKDSEGNVMTGQQQIGALLNKFGGNNPMEVFARAAADGKLGETLAGVDTYARQMGMSEAAKDKFQVLVKLLAENQVALRGASLNPTDAFGTLQQTASPNIGNSQRALVTLVDLMGHAEKNAQEKYNYAKENKLPYGSLENNIGYTNLMSKYAKEHADIATGNPMSNAPDWYNPSSGNVTSKPSPKAQSAAAGASQERPKERNLGGKTWVLQPDNTYKVKE